MILSIEERGLRFAVADPYGQEFCEQEQMFVEGEGTLYYTRNDAALKIRELLLDEYGDKPCKVYETKVRVEIFSDKEIDHETLTDWCMHSTRLILYPEHGLGPGGNQNLGLVSILWNSLKEVTQMKP